jgi:hypothetical protein
VHAEAEKLDALLAAVHQARFGFVELQSACLQPVFEPVEIRWPPPSRAEDHEVVGVTHHHWNLAALIVDGSVEGMKIQVRQERRDDSSLGRALLVGQHAFGSCASIFFHDGSFEPCSYEGEHGPVADAAGDPFHELVMGDAVEVTYDRLPPSETFPARFA